MNRIIIVLILCCMALKPVTAQVNYQNNTIKVTGSAEKIIEPNEIHLVVQLVEKRDKKYDYPMEKARTDFLAICKSVGISQADIDMSAMRSNLIQQRIRFWRKKKSEIMQRETYDIKFTDLNKMLAFIEKINQPYVQHVYFGEQTHTDITTYRKEVKMDAAKAAKQKASYLSQAADQTLGRVIYIEEKNDSYIYRGNQLSNSISYNKASVGGAAKVNFGFKPIKIRYEVDMIVALK